MPTCVVLVKKYTLENGVLAAGRLSTACQLCTARTGAFILHNVIHVIPDDNLLSARSSVGNMQQREMYENFIKNVTGVSTYYLLFKSHGVICSFLGAAALSVALL